MTQAAMTRTKMHPGGFRAVVAGTIGNAVEWIDWSIYGLSATWIAANFFPSGDPTVALLQSYALFAIGFLIRPVGAMILGPLGDKKGRNKILAFSIVLMAAGTGLIGAVPSFDQIGYLAPVLVLALRLIQGLAAGGEWGAATAFLYEFAPPDKKAFYGSFRPMSTGLGFAFGSVVMAITATFFSPEALDAWAWRIPFFVAFLLGGVGLYIRWQIDETPDFKKAQENNTISQKPLSDMMTMSRKAAVVMFLLVMMWNVVYYIVFTYMPVYLKTTLHVSTAVAMQTNSIVTLCYSFSIPFFGWLCDRYSKKRFMALSCSAFIILGIPAYMLLDASSYGNLLLIQGAMGLFMAVFSGPATAVFAELFPTNVRNTAISVTYTLNVSIFGGTAPMVCVWLISLTESPIAPAYYMALSAAMSLLAVLMIREDKDGKLSV